MCSKYLDSVGGEVVRAVIQHTFGASAAIETSSFLGMGAGNLAYLVSLRGDPRRYVLRFNRGFREDVYDKEAVNYRLVAEATGVRVPEIVSIDRSRQLVPTSYMVLEYLAGQDWTELCAPDNPDTSPQHKGDIRRTAGRFYAALHAMTRPASDGESTAHLIQGFGQFAAAARAGYLEVDLDKVAACEQVVRADKAVQSSTLSLCMADGEIFFEPRGDSYELAFVCDLEWVGFSNRLADISGQAIPGVKLFSLDAPVAVTPNRIYRDPFFQSYAASTHLDVEALARIALYTQLSMWGIIAAEPSPPEKKRWIREQKLPVISDLLRLIPEL